MANGMFDYFTDKAGRLRLPNQVADPQAAIDEQHRRARLGMPIGRNTIVPEMDPRPYPTDPAHGLGDDQPAMLVPPPPPVNRESEPEYRLRLARQQTDHLRDTYNNPVVNNDHGVMGRIGDVLRQAVISAGDAYNHGSGDPSQRLMAAIGGGVAGGIGGGFRPTLDEERQRLYDINRSQQNEQRYQGQVDTDQATDLRRAQTGAAIAEPQIRMAGILADVQKDKDQNLAQLRTGLLKQLESQIASGGYDPAVHTQLRDDLAKTGIHADAPLAPSDKYFSTALQNGGLAIVNTRTGESQLGLGGQTFEKPTTVTESDLTDDRFPGIMTDADIKRTAAAAVDPELSSVEINPQVQSDLVNYQGPGDDPGTFRYRNEDGTLNKNKFMQDTALGLAPMQYSSIYRSQAKGIQQKVAAKEQELVDSQKATRAELGTFKLALKGKPVGVANDAIGIFNAAMNEKNVTKRKKALKYLYEQLGN
jgi:hypothetical protein